MQKLIKPILPILLSTFFICVANSMLLGLFTLMGEQNNWSGSYIGAILSVKAVLAIIMAISTPWIIHHLKIVSSLLSHFVYLLFIAISLSFLSEAPSLWVYLYVTTIIATTFFFIRMESGIISVTPLKNRGKALSLYWVSAILGYVLGPVVISYSGMNSYSYYIVGAFFVLSFIAISAHRKVDKNNATKIKINQIIELIIKNPLIWIVIFIAGYTGETVLPFVGVIGIKLGFSGEDSLSLMSYFMLGGLLAQYIMGWLMDNLGVHKMTIYIAISAIIIGVGVAFSFYDYVVLSISIILWGTACFGVSLLGLTILGVMFNNRNNKLVVVAVGTVFYDFGNVIGNGINGIMIDEFGARGLIYSASIFFVIIMVVGFIHCSRHPHESV